MNLPKGIVFRLLLVSIFILMMGTLVNRRFIARNEGPFMFLLLEGAQQGEIKIYWNTGKGFNEPETSIVATFDYDQQVLKFNLPKGFKNFRIDTDIQSERFCVASCRLGYFRWPFSYSIPADNWLAANQLTKVSDLKGRSGDLVFEMEPGSTDPYCIVDIPPDVLSSEPWENLELYSWVIQIVTLLVGIFSAVITLSMTSSKKS